MSLFEDDISETSPLLTLKPAKKKSITVEDGDSRFGFQALRRDAYDIYGGTIPVSFIIATVIGVFCGVTAWIYYSGLEMLLAAVWTTAPAILVEGNSFWPESLYWLWIPIVGMTCAVLVGLSIVWLGFPGDLAYTVKCVHKYGYIPTGHTPAMIVASQLSIVGGASLGPEAPLVAICGSIAGWVSRSLFKQRYKNIVRKHTLCGMACALSAFFGVPLGGSLFALEINNRFGYEYFEHALVSILSGTVCLVVFRGLAGLPIGPIWTIGTAPLGPSTAYNVAIGIALGLVGAALAAVFTHGHWGFMTFLKRQGIEDRPVPLALVGGAGICILASLIPQTMFWGEYEFQTIASLSPASALPHIWPTTGAFGYEITGFGTAFLAGAAKLVAISLTVAGGYRGGYIFPLFCAGAAFGRSITFLFPSIPPSIATLCVAAGMNSAITRTALSTPLILVSLAGEINACPPVLAASLISTFATAYMPFIFSQQDRENIYESQFHSYSLSSGAEVLREQTKEYIAENEAAAKKAVNGQRDIEVGGMHNAS